MADKTTTLKTKTNDNVYPNVIGDNRDNAIVDSAHINHTLTKDHKINFRLDTNVSGLIFNSLQKPAGLTKTKLVGVGANGQENIEIGDNLILANGKLSATGGGTTEYPGWIYSKDITGKTEVNKIRINSKLNDDTPRFIEMYASNDGFINIGKGKFETNNTTLFYNYGISVNGVDPFDKNNSINYYNGLYVFGDSFKQGFDLSLFSGFVNTSTFSFFGSAVNGNNEEINLMASSIFRVFKLSSNLAVERNVTYDLGDDTTGSFNIVKSTDNSCKTIKPISLFGKHSILVPKDSADANILPLPADSSTSTYVLKAVNGTVQWVKES